jgi:hypothetical protein
LTSYRTAAFIGVFPYQIVVVCRFSTREFDTKAPRKSSYAAMLKCGEGARLRPFCGVRVSGERNVSTEKLTPLAAAGVS